MVDSHCWAWEAAVLEGTPGLASGGERRWRVGRAGCGEGKGEGRTPGGLEGAHHSLQFACLGGLPQLHRLCVCTPCPPPRLNNP